MAVTRAGASRGIAVGAGVILLAGVGVVAVRAANAPATAAAPTLRPGPLSLTVTWRATDGYSGADGHALTVWLSGDGGDSWAPVSPLLPPGASSWTATRLNPSTSYVARVTETTGEAEVTTESEPSPSAERPGAPPPVTGLTATPGDMTVRLSWTGPVGGDWRYAVWRAPHDAPDARQLVESGDAVPGTTYTDRTVVNGRTYRYQVQTIAAVTLPDAAAGSPLSTPVPVRPATLPAAPTGVVAVAGENRVRLRWDAVGRGADGGWPVTGYAVRAGAGKALPRCRRGTATPCIVGRVSPSGTVVMNAIADRPTAYGIFAHTRLGWSRPTASAAVQAYTLTPPFTPGMRGPAIRALQLRLTWAGLVTPLTSVYDKATTAQVNHLREKLLLDAEGTVTPAVWRELQTMTASDGALPQQCRGTIICVSKAQKVLRYLVNGRAVKTLDVRFGPEAGLSTPEGMFRINWKARDHISSRYRSPMPFTMNIVGGVAIHYSQFFAAVGYNGHSHGCINVRDWDGIEWLYERAPIGLPVYVYS